MSADAVSKRRLLEIADLFDLAPADAAVLLSQRHAGTFCYEIRAASSRYCLKLAATSHPVARLETTLRIQKALSDLGAPCAEPIPCGDEFQVRLREGVATMSRWVDGEAPDHPSPKTMERIGAVAATLHSRFQLPTQTIWPPAMPTLDDLRSSVVRSLDDNLRRNAAPGVMTLLAVLDAVNSRIGFDPEGQIGLIHGDLHHQNILMAPGHRCVLIDFDNCERGLLAKDIGGALYFAMDRSPFTSAKRMSSLLQGYGMVRQLSASEMAGTAQHLRRKGLEILAWTLLCFLRRRAPYHRVLSAARRALAADGVATALGIHHESLASIDWRDSMATLPPKLSVLARQLLSSEPPNTCG